MTESDNNVTIDMNMNESPVSQAHMLKSNRQKNITGIQQVLKKAENFRGSVPSEELDELELSPNLTVNDSDRQQHSSDFNDHLKKMSRSPSYSPEKFEKDEPSNEEFKKKKTINELIMLLGQKSKENQDQKEIGKLNILTPQKSEHSMLSSTKQLQTPDKPSNRITKINHARKLIHEKEIMEPHQFTTNNNARRDTIDDLEMINDSFFESSIPVDYNRQSPKHNEKVSISNENIEDSDEYTSMTKVAQIDETAPEESPKKKLHIFKNRVKLLLESPQKNPSKKTSLNEIPGVSEIQGPFSIKNFRENPRTSPRKELFIKSIKNFENLKNIIFPETCQTIASPKFNLIDNDIKGPSVFNFEQELSNHTVNLPLIKVDDHTFMLHTKNNHVQLSKYLRSWLRNHKPTTEDEYKTFLDNIIKLRKPMDNVESGYVKFKKVKPNSELARANSELVRANSELENSVSLKKIPNVNKVTQTDLTFFDMANEDHIRGLTLKDESPLTTKPKNKRDSFFEKIEANAKSFRNQELDKLPDKDPKQVYQLIESKPDQSLTPVNFEATIEENSPQANNRWDRFKTKLGNCQIKGPQTPYIDAYSPKKIDGWRSDSVLPITNNDIKTLANLEVVEMAAPDKSKQQLNAAVWDEKALRKNQPEKLGGQPFDGPIRKHPMERVQSLKQTSSQPQEKKSQRSPLANKITKSQRSQLANNITKSQGPDTSPKISPSSKYNKYTYHATDDNSKMEQSLTHIKHKLLPTLQDPQPYLCNRSLSPNQPKLILKKPIEPDTELQYNKFTQNQGKWLFTSNDQGRIIQWSTKDQSVVYDWGEAHEGGVHQIAVSDDGEHLFTAGWYGQLKQWSICKQRLEKNYGRIHEGFINSIVITRNSQFMFTTSRYGFQKQISIENQACIQDYKNIHEDWVWAMAATNDGHYLFTTGDNGYIKQWSIPNKSLNKNWGKINKGQIYSQVCTKNSESIITGDEFGLVREWAIKGILLKRDFGKIYKGHVWPMVVSGDGKYLVSCGGDGDSRAWITQWSLEDGVMVKHWEVGGGEEVVSMGVCKNGRIFMVGKNGFLSEWSTRKKMCVRDWGLVDDGGMVQCVAIG